jgi:uncharacterized membrane protein
MAIDLDFAIIFGFGFIVAIAVFFIIGQIMMKKGKTL